MPDSARTIDSLDEHTKIEIIGDYAKLLGKERTNELDFGI